MIETEAKISEDYASLLNERQNTLKQLVDITINEYSKTRDMMQWWSVKENINY